MAHKRRKKPKKMRLSVLLLAIQSVSYPVASPVDSRSAGNWLDADWQSFQPRPPCASTDKANPMKMIDRWRRANCKSQRSSPGSRMEHSFDSHKKAQKAQTNDSFVPFEPFCG